MYSVLVADPPWKFQDTLSTDGGTRGAEEHYACMTPAEIAAFPLPSLADDCVLFLWRVASQQQEALDVVKAWGFAPVKTELVWLKKTRAGKRWFGMGHVLRAEHEVCLIARRGSPEVLDHSVRSTFVTEVDGLSAAAGRHSEKPEEFYRIVELLYDGPYAELFARRQRPGWTCLGNEVE